MPNRLGRVQTLGERLCRTLNVNGGMVDGEPRRGCCVPQGDRSKKTANRTAVAAGPFAGPKPESMMVPRGAGRSRPAGASESARAGAQIPSSWSWEFDSRHPLWAMSLVRAAFANAAMRISEHTLGPGHNVGH